MVNSVTGEVVVSATEGGKWSTQPQIKKVVDSVTEGRKVVYSATQEVVYSVTEGGDIDSATGVVNSATEEGKVVEMWSTQPQEKWLSQPQKEGKRLTKPQKDKLSTQPQEKWLTQPLWCPVRSMFGMHCNL